MTTHVLLVYLTYYTVFRKKISTHVFLTPCTYFQ